MSCPATHRVIVVSLNPASLDSLYADQVDFRKAFKRCRFIFRIPKLLATTKDLAEGCGLHTFGGLVSTSSKMTYYEKPIGNFADPSNPQLPRYIYWWLPTFPLLRQTTAIAFSAATTHLRSPIGSLIG